MNAHGTRRISLILGFLFLSTYVAAKIHFFTRFSYFGTAAYLREHSIYWIMMAVLAFTVWLIEKLGSGSA